MIDLDIFVVDSVSKDRAFLDTCHPETADLADIHRTARERIIRIFRLHAGLMYSGPILLKQTSTELTYAVVWKDSSVELAQYDLYTVEVHAIDEAEVMPTEVLYVHPTFQEMRQARGLRERLRNHYR